MAIETLEQRVKIYELAIVDSLRRRTSHTGSILNIGQHVWDYQCKFEDENYQTGGKDIPLDAIFEFDIDGKVYYGAIDSNKLSPEQKIDSWFNEIGKIPLEYLSSNPPNGHDFKDKQKEGKVLKVYVDEIEHGGSAGNSAVAEKVFLDYITRIVERSKHPDKKKVLRTLNEINVLYSGIDSNKNGFGRYYSDFGVKLRGSKSSLMIRPEGYHLPVNLIFERGVKTVLQSPAEDFDPNYGAFSEQLSRTNFYDLGMVMINSAKHNYLLQEGLKLFSDPGVIKTGAFTNSSLNANRNLILNRLIRETDVLVENRDEIKALTGKGLYDGIDSLAEMNHCKDFSIYVTMDSEGIMASGFRNGVHEYERYSTPYNPNLKKHHKDNEPKFTGAGDVAIGVALIGSLLNLPTDYTLELANLFAQYRISHPGIHEYAEELQGELAGNKRRLSIEKYEIDPARGNSPI